MMQKTIKIELRFCKNGGGNKTEETITYYGKDDEDIANQIKRDEGEVLYYMRTGDMKKEKCFCFEGLMIKKAGLYAARFSEADF